MAPTFAEISKARYILPTTFTKDGRPKPTAVGAAPHGDRLLVHTEEDSWKIKRIRNTPRVTVAVCDMRGRPKGSRSKQWRRSSTRRTPRMCSGLSRSATGHSAGCSTYT
jgi:PPOX class probable F420-dependent enzyme